MNKPSLDMEKSDAAELGRRTEPSQARAQERVDKILRATERLLAEGGYDALNMSAIAAEAGIRTPSLYHYFANKRAIVAALAQAFLDEQAEGLDELIGEIRRSGDWHTGLHYLIEALAADYWSDPAIAAILQALKGDPELRKLDLELNDSFADMFDQLLEAAGAKGPPEVRWQKARFGVLIADAFLMEVARLDEIQVKPLAAEFEAALTLYFGTFIENGR